MNVLWLIFASIFLKFLPFSAFLQKKFWRNIFQSAFWVCSTQALVEVYNTGLPKVSRVYLQVVKHSASWAKNRSYFGSESQWPSADLDWYQVMTYPEISKVFLYKFSIQISLSPTPPFLSCFIISATPQNYILNTFVMSGSKCKAVTQSNTYQQARSKG